MSKAARKAKASTVADIWIGDAPMHTTRGYAYLTVLFVIAVMTNGLALIGTVWETNAQREREAQLLHVGQEYRKAIERYYLAGSRQYPREFNDLVKDPRKPSTERYLRKHHTDPITGNNTWGIVKGPDGGIMGVYSLSEEVPLKQTGFRLRDANLEGAQTYVDWKFIYTTQAPVTPRTSATSPTTATSR